MFIQYIPICPLLSIIPFGNWLLGKLEVEVSTVLTTPFSSKPIFSIICFNCPSLSTRYWTMALRTSACLQILCSLYQLIEIGRWSRCLAGIVRWLISYVSPMDQFLQTFVIGCKRPDSRSLHQFTPGNAEGIFITPQSSKGVPSFLLRIGGT